MGAEYLFSCSKCGFNLTTSGPWEFVRGNTGEFKYYRGSGEVGEKGIDGLSGTIYCPGCRKTYDMILAEFEHPVHTEYSLWSLWADPGNNFMKQNNIKCSVCGSTSLVMEPADDLQLDCPNCPGGTLQGRVKSIF
jgi:hypothetical protein